MTNLTLLLERIQTPIGEMLLVTDQTRQYVHALDWQDYETRLHVLMKRQYKNSIFSLQLTKEKSSAHHLMLQYFAGNIHSIDHIQTNTGGTEFQKAVWRELKNIEAAHPISYRTLASRIGKPAAIRAVGAANGANPIGIIVPCHRVIGANNALTGYGGGLERKKWLLNHEANFSNR